MSLEDNISKLCSKSHLEIPETEIEKTSQKIKDVIKLFDKLDEFDKADISAVDKQFTTMEITIDDLRDDVPQNNLMSSPDYSFSFKFLNTKNGYVVAPRI